MLSKLLARITAHYSAARIRAMVKSDQAMVRRKIELERQLLAIRKNISAIDGVGPSGDVILGDLRWKLHQMEHRLDGQLQTVLLTRRELDRAIKTTMVELKMARLELGIIE